MELFDITLSINSTSYLRSTIYLVEVLLVTHFVAIYFIEDARYHPMRRRDQDELFNIFISVKFEREVLRIFLIAPFLSFSFVLQNPNKTTHMMKTKL